MSAVQRRDVDKRLATQHHHSHNSEVIQELQTADLRTRSFSMAERLWNRVFTEADRETLEGDLDASYRQLGTIGMWMKARSVCQNQAIIEVACHLGFMDDSTACWLRRELQLDNAKDLPTSDRPVWDRSTGQLRFKGRCIRKVRVMKSSSNIQTILDAFERADWPRSVTNPLPYGQQQLHQALRSLRKGLRKISFHSHQGGRAISWRVD